MSVFIGDEVDEEEALEVEFEGISDLFCTEGCGEDKEHVYVCGYERVQEICRCQET